MSEKRRSYTEEFKVEAVKLLRESEESAAQIARELGIPQTNLSRWKREREEDPEGAFPGKGNARRETRVTRSWPVCVARTRSLKKNATF